jgi:phospholipid/cholesterol/gamma-HCH transport system substrate-binding protein
MQFRVGVMVLATIIITVTLALMFGELPTFGRRTNTLHVQFTDAPGVTRDTPVRKSGILIGRVSDIRFADNDRTVLVTAEIDRERKIYSDEACRINNSLIGIGADTVLEIVPGPNPTKARMPISNNGEIEGLPAQEPARVLADLQQGLRDSMSEVQRAGRDLHETLTKVNKVLGDNGDTLSRIITRTDTALESMQKTFDYTNDIIGDPATRDNFKLAVKQLPNVLTEARNTAKSLNDAMVLVQRNLVNLEGLTEPLGQKGKQLVERIDAGTKKLDQVMDEALTFTQALNNKNGSLGRLMNDPELYQHVARAARNVDQLTRELQPIIDDARRFSQKIAQHPEVLGVRGAIQRSSGIP